MLTVDILRIVVAALAIAIFADILMPEIAAKIFGYCMLLVVVLGSPHT